MKKISLTLSILSSVCLLSCTDYKADIQDAHDSFVRRNIYDHDCECYIADESFLTQPDGVYHYNTTSGVTYIDYGVKCASSQVSDIKADDFDRTFVSSADVSVDGDMLFGIRYFLNTNAAEGKVSGQFFPTVALVGAPGFDEILQCPMVYFEAVPEEPGPDNFEEESSSSARSSSSVVESSSSNRRDLCGERHTDLWDGSKYEYRVITGVDAGKNESGWWFNYADDKDGGGSYIDFPVPLGNEFADDAKDPVIDYCGGLCGTVYLDVGTLTYDPFVGLGFNVAGPAKNASPTKSVAVDISSWGGLCFAYSAEHRIRVELGLGDDIDAEYHSNLPGVYLPKSQDTEHYVCYEWSDFKQEDWDMEVDEITGEEASEKVVAIKFKVQDEDGTVAYFNIISLGTYNCP